MHLPKILRHFLRQTVLWTLLCLGTESICRFMLHWGYPYDYPAVPFGWIFGDFSAWTYKFQAFHTTHFFSTPPESQYPAAALVLYKLFLFGTLTSLPPKYATTLFLSVIVLISIGLVLALRKALIGRGLMARDATVFSLILYLCSFPFWFEVHQGNVEFFVWMVLLLGITAFWLEKPWVAAICFGAAGAMKIFPIIFVGLFIARKQYKYPLVSLLVAGLVTVFSLWLLCPDIHLSWVETQKGLDHFRQQQVLNRIGMNMGFDHSLFALIKRLFHPLPSPATMARVLNVYMATVAVGGVILFFARIRKLPLINQIMCLSIAAILLPPVSYDYTLVHLYAPFALVVFAVLQKPVDSALQKGFRVALGLFAFLLAPEQEFLAHRYRFAAQLKCLALIALWIVALIYRFEAAPHNSRAELAGELTDARMAVEVV